MITINNQLKDRAERLFIKYGSDERSKIDRSLLNLKSKLKTDFGNRIVSTTEFGSFKRGTILPRSVDPQSDIDLLIVFNHATLNITPNTYRTYLKDFATKYYSRSAVYKDSPTVVLELEHIKYDLVPCYLSEGWFGSTYYIPDNSNSWMSSDIYGFNQKLTEVNTQYNSIVKPIIRLLKAWNVKAGYPLDSYALEQEISQMNFYNDNYETGFFWAATHLSHYGRSQTTLNKIISLENNVTRLKKALSDNSQLSALSWLNHILP